MGPEVKIIGRAIGARYDFEPNRSLATRGNELDYTYEMDEDAQPVSECREVWTGEN